MAHGKMHKDLRLFATYVMKICSVTVRKMNLKPKKIKSRHLLLGRFL